VYYYSATFGTVNILFWQKPKGLILRKVQKINAYPRRRKSFKAIIIFNLETAVREVLEPLYSFNDNIERLYSAYFEAIADSRYNL